MTVFQAPARLGAVLFVAVALCAGSAAAQSGRAGALQRLTDCRKLTDSAQRLACYDQAVDGFDQAEAKGDIVVVDREQARAVRRQAFGFNLPSLSLFDRGEKAEAVDNVTLKIESATRTADGKWLLRLEGGQVWRQIDTAELARAPKAGGTATVKAASLGSFKLSTGGASAIRVHREN
jgi:hypothetical protein